jgi:hypothetical protein
MRHAVLRIAVAHGQEQKLTTMQFAIRDKYVGSGLIDHSQKMTTAAMHMADMNV